MRATQLARAAAALPLSGIRVVEMEALAAVPWAGMCLADFGAEVIRVDNARHPPHFGTTVLGRGKTSVALDLKTSEGRRACTALAATADVLLEGYRPTVMERLGLGPDDLCADECNPGLIYCRLTGFGQDGPYAQRAGHDINYIAITGALHAMTRGAHADPAARPLPPLNLLGDFAGGALSAVTGVLMALVARQGNEGRGQVVDAAMVDGTAYLMSFIHHLGALGRWNDARPGTNLLDTGAPFYDTYACKDGAFVAVGAIEPQFYALLLEGLGLGAGAGGDGLPDQMDVPRWGELRQAFAAAFKTRTRDDWASVFDERGDFADACVTPVLSMTEAAANPHNVSRGLFQQGDSVGAPTPAPRLSATPAQPAATDLQFQRSEAAATTSSVLRDVQQRLAAGAAGRNHAAALGDADIEAAVAAIQQGGGE